MATRERPADRGARIARADLVRIGGELREARIAAGLSLDSVGLAVGISGTHVARIERAKVPTATILQLSRIGAAVGLDVRVRAYPGPDPIRDAGQNRVLERFRGRLLPDLGFRTEVPLPDPGDQRAWDGWVGRLRSVGDSGTDLPVEVESRITDVQAQTRRIALKLRDSGVGCVLVVVADTKANRDAVAAGRRTIDELFPIPPRRALAALAAGDHPGGSALIFL